MRKETAYREFELQGALTGFYSAGPGSYYLRIECDDLGVHVVALADDPETHPEAGSVLDLTHEEALRLMGALRETDEMWRAYRNKRASDTSASAEDGGKRASGQAEG